MSEPSFLLVVDDDEAIRETIALLLEQEGYHVLAAADGEQALATMRDRGAPALLLLDLRMPRMSGAELAAEMRRDPRLAPTPVVVLSGDLRAFDQAPVLEAVAYLKKPCDLDDLLAAVRRWTAPAPGQARRGERDG